ncbi:MAG TPA: hypothetical protein VF956_12230 [Candidatus Dormibacteraeota bacterium]
MDTTIHESSRPEGAFILLLLQSIFWMVAGLSSLPFGLAGELHMAALGLVTLMFALATCLLGIAVLWRRLWARRVALTLEVVCVIGSALQLLLPIGANRGPVALLVDIVLPVAVVWLLWDKKTRSAFS